MADEPSDQNNGGRTVEVGASVNGVKFNASLEASAGYERVLNRLTTIDEKQDQQLKKLGQIEGKVDNLDKNPMIQLGKVLQQIPQAVVWGVPALASVATALHYIFHTF